MAISPDQTDEPMSGEYPRPWRVEERVHAWFVVDARGGIVAGPFTAEAGAYLWLERWPNGIPGKQ